MGERKFYYYCPDCGYEQTLEYLPSGCKARFFNYWVNPIYALECNQCHSQSASIIAVPERNLENNYKLHFQNLIKLCRNLDRCVAEARIIEVDEEHNA